MRAHLLVFDSSQVDRKTVQNAVDGLGEVANWYGFFGNALCLASGETAKSLTRLLGEALPDIRFLVVTVDPDEKGGWMPKAIWEFLNDPRSAEIEAA